MRFWKSFAISSMFSPLVGGAAEIQKVNVLYELRERLLPHQAEPSADSPVLHSA